MTNNEGSLKAVESAVADVETEIAKLDAIDRQVGAGKQALQKLAADNLEIRSDAGADPKKRAAALTTSEAHLDLMRGDLLNLERQAETQRKWVTEVGKTALSRVMQIWSKVHLHCKAVAEQEIRLSFDTGRLLMPVDHLVACRLDVLMAKQLQDRLFSVQYADPNGLMEELRRLRERFIQVSNAVADEPGLVLNLAKTEDLKAKLPEGLAALEPTPAQELALA